MFSHCNSDLFSDFGWCSFCNLLFEVSPNTNYCTIIYTQTGTKGLIQLKEFHHWVPHLYGTFTSSITPLCETWHNTFTVEWTGKKILRAVCLCGCSRCRRCGGQCSPVERAQVTPASAGLFLLSGHTVANLALTASVSSWHLALFIPLIIVRLRHFLESNRGAKPGSETFLWTDESMARVWPETDEIYFVLQSLSLRRLCLCGRLRDDDVYDDNTESVVLILL